jgi:hypothetical protein
MRRHLPDRLLRSKRSLHSFGCARLDQLRTAWNGLRDVQQGRSLQRKL